MLDLITLALIKKMGGGGGAQGGKMEVVTELPPTGEKGTIYLLPKEGTAPQDNLYEEWIWVDAWERLSSEIDLSNYYDKTEVDEKIDKALEVQVSTEEPTDENITLWINPEEEPGELPVYTKGETNELFTPLEARVTALERKSSATYTKDEIDGFNLSFDQRIVALENWKASIEDGNEVDF